MKKFYLLFVIILTNLHMSALPRSHNYLSTHQSIIENSVTETVNFSTLMCIKCPTCKDKNIVRQKYHLRHQEKKKIYNHKVLLQNIYLENNDAIYFDIHVANNKNHFIIRKRPEFPPYHTFKNVLRCSKKIDTHDALITLPKNVTPRDFLNFLDELYKKNNLLKVLPTKSIEPKIPKIIHHIWFGKPLPILYKKWKKTWKINHPDWRHICWSLPLIKKHFPHGLENQLTFEKALALCNFGKASDIARYEIVNKFGGLYTDTDTMCYRNLEVLHHCYDFVSIIEPFTYPINLMNALFASKPCHPILIYCINRIKKFESKEINKSWPQGEVAHTILTTGPGAFSRAVLKGSSIPGNKNVVFPPQFCPAWNKRTRKFRTLHLPNIKLRQFTHHHPVISACTLHYAPFFTHCYEQSWVKKAREIDKERKKEDEY